MKPLSLVPFLLAYVLGISFALSNPSELLFPLVFFGCFWGVYCWTSRGDVWQLLFIVSFFILGLGRGQLEQFRPKKHYSLYVTPQAESHFLVRFTEKLRENKFHQRFYGEIILTNDSSSEGTVLITIDKSNKVFPKIGDEYGYTGRLSPIRKPKNPFDFNFSGYLQKLGVYHSLAIENTLKLSFHRENPSLLQRLNGLLSEKIENSGWQLPTQNIIKTMVLGKRHELASETLQNYADAGVIHLFAISGLHIGLLMVFFQWLLQPIRRLPLGSVGHNLIVLLLLWSYAFLVGASASVLRSVTLFSSFQLAQLSQRSPPTSYMVLLSMVLLLTINPWFIFQLGFQMSYLAVYGILFLRPLMEIRWKYRICR